ncbi:MULTISPECIES: Ig-like domain-containing protein [unclassified Pseudoalteromonas]|uniref:Ig-like domain-containing protein n=1 Tax=unclassified Pseudoalteromonas TaxID=194690 RepID=UPI001F0F2D10
MNSKYLLSSNLGRHHLLSGKFHVTKLALFLSTVFSASAVASTFTFDNSANNTGDGSTTFTSTTDGVTLTATQSAGRTISYENILSGFMVPTTSQSGETWTMSFSSNISITQFDLGQFSGGGVGGTYTFTPDSGTAVTISDNDPDWSGDSLATLTASDWTSVSTVVVSYVGGGFNGHNLGIDNIEFMLAPSDSTAPLISEVTPVTTPTNDNTPNYTFTTNEAGTLSVGGSCGTSTSTTIGGTGNQTITLTQTDNSTALADGTYSNCTITVTDAANNPSSVLNITTFTVDTTAPAVAEVTAVTTPGSDSTPSYTFSTTETGTLSVGGSCGTSSSTTISSTGNQTITLTQTDNSTPLVDGTYSNCTITITDAAGNANTPLAITAFTIDSIGPTYDGANSTPNDDATGVAGNANIVVDFNENISLGTGNITIRDVSSNSDFEVFNVATESDGTTTSPSAGRIGITNDKIYINPSNNLTGNRNYAIRIDATAVDDSAGNSFLGINDDTSFNFSTGNTAPAVDLDSTSGSDDSSVLFSEGAGAVNIAANAAVAEADGDTITTITVSLTNDQDGVSEGLNISASAQDALTGVSGSSDITLQDTISITGATASAAEVQTFLQAITYNNTSSSPNQTSRTVTVVINDGTDNSTSRTATISVNNATAAISTAASFNTTNGTNLSPAITFTSDDETLTIADPSHIVGSIADGGAGTDILSVATGSNLVNFTTLTNFETLTPENDGSLTLTETQHDAFTTINGSGTNQFTISSADGDQSLIGDSDIESYVLGSAMSFTLASPAQSVTGSTGVDTIDVAGFTTTGTLAGGAGTDTLRADNGANISGATLSGFESLTLSDNASITMTEAQHDSFSTITAAATETITISDVSDGLTGNSAIETYILSAANSFTLGAVGQSVTGSSGDDTVNIGTLNATGTLAGGSGTDTLILSNSGNIAGATVSGFENLSVAENGSATISVAQLSSFTGTVSGSGSESLTLSGDGDITTISAIESYTLSDDSTNARTVTVSNTNHSVTATSTSDAVIFDLGSLTYTGTITGDNTTADTLSLGSGADITAATINGVSNLTVESGANVAMTVSQHQSFNGILTASGSETITLSGDGDITALTGIENYLVGDDSSNTRTITILSGTTSVTANSTSDAITFAIGGSAYSGTLTGDSSVADSLLVTDGADVSGGVFNSIGTLSLASGASVAIDAENLNDFTTGITGSTGIETLNLMDGGTFNFATTNVTGIEGIAIGTNNLATINLTDNFNADTQTVSVTNTTGSAITADLVIDASAFVGDVLEISAADFDGADTMIGGSGADTFRPGGGTDTITGNGGNDNFIGESSDLNGDTLTDLSIGDVITITGITGLSTSNVRFNGSSTLEIDTDATDFSSPEISLSLTNAPASDLVYTVADSGSDTVITFGSSNSGPVFSGLNGGSTFTEGGSAIVIDANVTVADSELDALNSGNGNYDGASVTIARAGGANSNDLFTNTGLLGALTQGGVLSYNSNVVGAVTTNSAGTLQLTFNSNATSVIVDSVLQAIGYINNANNPASPVTLNYTFNDGVIDSTGTNQAIVTIVPPSVPSNNAPVISGQPITSIDEDTLYSFTPSATDSDGDSLEFSITNLPLWASFDNTTGTISGTPIEGQSGSYDNIVITVSDGELESALAAFNISVNPVNDAPVIFGVPPIEVKQGENYSFTPTVEDVDSDTFSFSVSNLPAWLSFDTSTGRLSGTPDITDVGNYENIVISVSDGSLQASLEGFSILVTATNAAPVANDMQRNVQEDGTTSFVADVQDANDDSLVIELISQPENGNVQVQGTIFTYTPSPNFNGNDTFTYRVFDGQLSSNDASVVINVSAVNDVPVANDDNFNFAAVSDNQYILSVLENDTDADGDALRIIGAKASIGTVSINNNTLSYQAIENTQGPILVNYIIEDENKARAEATATIAINSDDSSAMPVITAPADLTVNATGLFTKVDLGIAMAFDSSDNPLPVSLVRGAPIFAPGKHLVYWQTEDNEGQQVTTTQQLNVNPLVSLQKDSRVAEDKEHAVKVYLNGPAPSYPVVIPYTVSGTADSADHDLQSGELVISSGVSASIPLMIFADSSDEGNETIVITLGDSVNKGAKSTSTVTIVEDNVAPNIETLVLQNNQQRSIITASDELVTITANVSDPNPTDEVTVEWDSAPEFVNTSNDPFIFEFNPAVVASGIYKVRVTAKDDAVPSLSTMKDVYIEVIPSLPELTAVDSDGDLIPDDQEGYVDSDSDGIPDFMDAISDCNVMQEQALESSKFLVEGDPGVCLRKGATVPQNNTGGLQLLETELPEDPTASNTGGLFDFIATGLPQVGDTYSIVLPQRQPIPVNGVYRKLINGDWQNFVTVDDNEVLSAQGEPGFCPPPGSNEWTTGLSEGDWCVQLRIVDGGPNDDDGVANGSIVDPGGVAVPTTGNNAPIANADAVTIVAEESVVIDVIANDEDIDNDTLTITGATVDFGTVVLENNQLVYTPIVGFIGDATIQYSISDGMGGTANSTAIVTIKVNQAPVTQNDSASSNGETITIDVLANDSDPEQGELFLVSATTEFGTSVVNSDGTLSYSPASGFEGVDTINYIVRDAQGAQSQGSVSVTVELKQTVNVSNKSSGGGLGMITLLVVSAFVVRRRVSRLPSFAFLSASCVLASSAAAEDWQVSATLGQATAQSSYSSEQWVQTAIDDESVSWSVGAFYNLKPNWKLGIRYIDLGEASVNFSKETSNPEQAHSEVLDKAPALPNGLAIQANYLVDLVSSLKGELFLGAYHWKYKINSRRDNLNTIVKRGEGTDLFIGAGINYQILDSVSIGVDYTRYFVSKNDINEIAFSMNYQF